MLLLLRTCRGCLLQTCYFATNNELLSFMDGFSSYNEILIAIEDIPKTAFRCPDSIWTFEWLVMPFGFKNAGATY